MNTQVGAVLHGDDEEARSEAARLMGKSRTDKKLEALAVNRARVSDPDVREKLRAAQTARRERERADREAAGLVAVASLTEKRRPGRPKKETMTAETTPKRPVGRPRKQDAQTAMEIDTNAGKGV